MTTTERVRNVAVMAIASLTLAVTGVVATPAAQAGLPSEPAGPPAAYTVVSADLLVSCVLATVDLTDGTTTPLPTPGSAEACVADLAVAPDGSVWGVREVGMGGLAARLVEFDPASGAVLSDTPLTGSFATSGLADGGIAFDAAGTMYVQIVTDETGCESAAVCLYTVDPATAVATFVGNPGPEFGETVMFYLGADCAGSMVTSYEDVPGGAGFGDEDTDAQEAFSPMLAFVDPATGVVTGGPALDPEDFLLAGLDYSRADGTLYALGSTAINGSETPGTTAETTETTEATEGEVGPATILASLYTLDPTTGALSLVADLSEPTFNVETLGIAGTCPVPEPIVLVPTFTG